MRNSFESLFEEKKVAKEKTEAKTEDQTNDGNIVVVSKIKEYLNSKGMQASGELVESLNAKVYGALNGAIKRASANKRKRPKAVDL